MTAESIPVCDFCGSMQAEPFLSLKDLRLGLPGKWDLFRCSQCGLLYLFPQPEAWELARHYPENYHAYLSSSKGLLSRLRSFGVNRRIRAVRHFNPQGERLLDVGCATGEFLRAFADQTGWQVVGIEVIPQAAELARQKGLEIIEQDLLNADFPAESFDVITLWDVLEHLTSPNAALQECRRLLKDGGLLVIKAPNPSGGEAKLFGSEWIGYEAPQHLFGFPEVVLRAHLEALGFKEEALQQIGSDYAAFFLSLGYWLQEHGAAHLGKLVIYLLRTRVGRVLGSIFARLLRILGLKSSQTYFVTKSQPEIYRG